MKLVYNDKIHGYWLDGKRCKGVTSLAKVPDDKFTLELWQQRMIAIGLTRDPSLVEAVAVNFDDKEALNGICEKAKEVAGAFVASNRGTTLHRVAERHDLGLELIDTPTNVAIRQAWGVALEESGLEAVSEWVERIVCYPEYLIGGRFDRLMRRVADDMLVVVDAKGGENAIKYPHSISIQLALYANAPLVAGPLPSAGGETYDFGPLPENLDRATGYIIHMPTNERAEVVEIDIAAGWDCFNEVILGTLRWRSRRDLVRGTSLEDLLDQSTRAAAGQPLGEVSPAAAPDIAAPVVPPTDEGRDAGAGDRSSPAPATKEEETCPGSSTINGPLTSCAGSTLASASCPSINSSQGQWKTPSETCSTASDATGSGNPPTTTSETTLKSRLAQIRQHQPELATVIVARWPITKRLNEAWTDDETATVAAFLDKEDPEGPYVTGAEMQRVAALVATLTPTQLERVTEWVLDAARSPGHELSLGGGWTTTRRVCLAEVCALTAKHGTDESMLWSFLALEDDRRLGSFEPTIGATLAAMTWREAQHLLAITRLHLNLDATIEQETTSVQP